MSCTFKKYFCKKFYFKRKSNRTIKGKLSTQILTLLAVHNQMGRYLEFWLDIGGKYPTICRVSVKDDSKRIFEMPHSAIGFYGYYKHHSESDGFMIMDYNSLNIILEYLNKDLVPIPPPN